jgi:predicted CoA-binding protein
VKKTLVLGASDNPERYSYMAVALLKKYGHPVLAIGRKAATIGDTIIHGSTIAEQGVDTVTLYLNPLAQEAYYSYIISLEPKRIIFNPGTENEALEDLAKHHGIQCLEACTLVLLNTGQY